MGKALYRKYRPVKLSEVVGQETTVKALESSIKADKISHAYLFTGPRGCGKTSVARIFAHEINHLKYELEDSHLDIIEIDAASNTGVDNIRELREKAIIAPSEAKYKVYIIDEVHMLSKSAFNALLKLLEEPPAHVVFIMATTNPEKVPITITSRAQVYTFKLADTKTLEQHLAKIAKAEQLNISKDALNLIAKRGAGSFRDAISLLDQISTLSDQKITAETVTQALGLPQEQSITELLSAYQAGDQTQIITLLKDLLNSGTRAELISEELIFQIINQPDSKLFSLLSKLPEVKAPFAEAKLLVAMVEELNPPTPTNPPTQITKAAKVSVPQTTAPSTQPFSWDEYLERVKAASPTVHHSLVNCQYQLQGTCLHLYPTKSFDKRLLSANNNHQLLITNSGGLTIEIHDQPQPLSNSSQLSKISDIMGNIQEVKDGGVIPF